MERLTALQSAIAWALKAVDSDPEHRLLPYYRFEVYKALGPSAHSPDGATQLKRIRENKVGRTSADWVRAWLDYNTICWIMPVWEVSIPELFAIDASIPMLSYWVLDLTYELLIGNMSDSQAFDLQMENFYFDLHLYSDVRYQHWKVFEAAYHTLERSIGLGLAWMNMQVAPTATDSNIEEHSVDVAAMAVRGWSVIDPNPPGSWRIGGIIGEKSIQDIGPIAVKAGVATNPKPNPAYAWLKPTANKPQPLIIDYNKQRQFWHWWLTTGIDDALSRTP